MKDDYNPVLRVIDDLGRIVIPKEVREKMGISAGDTLLMTFANGKVVVEAANGIDKPE